MILSLWNSSAHSGLAVSHKQADALAGYLEELSQWNRVHSLTAISGTENQVRRHIMDALVVWPEIVSRFGQNPALNIADVGSGMGVPGVVWAIVLPFSRFDLIERQQKKASFLRHLVGRLGMGDRVRVLASDVGQLAPDSRYDLITSRAFAALPDFLAVTDAIASSDTLWLAMIGKKEVSDHTLLKMERTGKQFLVEAVRGVKVPGLAEDRHIAWIRRAP